MNLNTKLSEAGYTFAVARPSSVENMVEYGTPAMRAYCRGDNPGDWKLCQKGAAGENNWCSHLHGDFCKPAGNLLPAVWPTAPTEPT